MHCRARAALVLLLVWLVPAGAAASDFWEEVRTPGLRAWRHHVSQARAALRARRWDSALQAADRAIEALDDRAEGHVLRGRALGELGRVEPAVEAFERALELEPEAFGASEHGAHAARLCAEGQAYEVAARVLEWVVGRMPVSAQRYELYVLYGDVLLSLGPDHLREAILAYREALRRNQTVDPRAGLGLALALRRAGERLEANDIARAAVARGRVEGVIAKLPVPSSEKSARRAVARDGVGDLEGAARAWQQASEGDVWTRHARAELQGDETQAGSEDASRAQPSRRGRR